MSMKIDSFCPVKIISGENCVKESGEKIKNLGKKCIIVTSKTAAKASGALDDLIDVLNLYDIDYTIYDGITPNPQTVECYEAGKIAKCSNADFVVGIGGGSALDAAKAVAIYAKNDIDVDDIFSSSKLDSLPLCLIGTTCGTGSEVTGVSVLTDSSTHRKKSIHGENCYATVSFCDYRYSSSQSKKTLLSTVLDAFCHAMESFLSKKSNDISRLFAEKALKNIWCFLRTYEQSVDENKEIQPDKEMLYLSSIYAGLAINITGTCAPHTLGYFLSEKYNVPHGMACALFEVEFLKTCTDTQVYARFLDVLECTFEEFNDVFSECAKWNLHIDSQIIDKEKPRWSGKINSFMYSPVEFTADMATDIYKKLFS